MADRAIDSAVDPQAGFVICDGCLFLTEYTHQCDVTGEKNVSRLCPENGDLLHISISQNFSVKISGQAA